MDLSALIRDQDGLIHGDQARRYLSRWAISRRVADGFWRPVAPHVYLDRTHRFTVRARVRAAWMWGGEAATLTGVAAATWWGLPHAWPRTVDGAMPPGCRRTAPAGVRVVRRAIAEDDRMVLEGVRVTRLATTVIDAAVALGGDGRRFLDRALQRHVTLEEVVASHEARPRRRRAPEAAELLRQAVDRTASEPERRTVRLLREAGIGGFVVNHAVRLAGRTALIDLAFPREKVAVEVAGWAFHRDRARFVDDPRRRNALILAGWTVLEFTWEDVTARPATVVATIRAAIAGAR